MDIQCYKRKRRQLFGRFDGTGAIELIFNYAICRLHKKLLLFLTWFIYCKTSNRAVLSFAFQLCYVRKLAVGVLKALNLIVPDNHNFLAGGRKVTLFENFCE